MSSRTFVRALNRGLIIVATTALCAAFFSTSWAGNFRFGSVGGVVIKVDGVVQNATAEQIASLAKMRRAELKTPGPEINKAVPIRKISLKALEAACAQYLREGGRMPDEIRYLGGLQRIQYVLVYPESHDVVLAGPAEGWTVNDHGDIVGVTTGRPVLHLDDLLVALRSVDAARHGGISCSIDPTDEGYRNLTALLARQRQSGQRVNPAVLEPAMKQAFGPQQVKLGGVPANSHLARILVAADYRMKRLAMNLDPAPIAKFPSYVDLIKNAGTKSANVNPRWWLACNYQPLAKSPDGLVWQLRGQGVKCLTEDEIVTQQGAVKGTGRTSPAAEKWANLMTEKFDELAAKETIFAQLRNVMDLCVVAALIDQHDLCSQAGCTLPLLTSQDSDLLSFDWYPPKQLPPQCSFLKTRRGWVVTASGGVQINAFQVVSNVAEDNAIRALHDQAANSSTPSWWWN